MRKTLIIRRGRPIKHLLLLSPPCYHEGLFRGVVAGRLFLFKSGGVISLLTEKLVNSRVLHTAEDRNLYPMFPYKDASVLFLPMVLKDILPETCLTFMSDTREERYLIWGKHPLLRK